MNKTFIEEQIIPRLPQSNVLLGRALMVHLVNENDFGLIDTLQQYQNPDGGFGHGLEADIQMDKSNVASSNIVVNLLEDMTNESAKMKMIQQLVAYYETVYDEAKKAFEFVPKDVDLSPRAIWWNYDQLDSFTYGNPNPEVAGFLYQYQEFVTTIDIQSLVEQVVKYINEVELDGVSMHSLLSMLRFYHRVDPSIQKKVVSKLQTMVDHLVELNPKKWDDYCLEPYKIARIEPQFLEKYPTIIAQNLEKYELLLQDDLVRPNWEWYQYEDVFEQVKDNWVPLLTYDVLYVMLYCRKQ